MELTFPRRFRGPLDVGERRICVGESRGVSRWRCDRGHASPAASSRTTARRASAIGDSAVLLDGDAVVAEARVAAARPRPARAGLLRRGRGRPAARFVRIGNPVFRECFVCGVRDERRRAGNLRRPGGRSRAAARGAVDGLRGVPRARLGRDRLSRRVRGRRGRERRPGPRPHDGPHRSRPRDGETAAWSCPGPSRRTGESSSREPRSSPRAASSSRSRSRSGSRRADNAS